MLNLLTKSTLQADVEEEKQDRRGNFLQCESTVAALQNHTRGSLLNGAIMSVYADSAVKDHIEELPAAPHV